MNEKRKHYWEYGDVPKEERRKFHTGTSLKMRLHVISVISTTIATILSIASGETHDVPF